jgi:tRNA pseudouridine38-40 synthase
VNVRLDLEYDGSSFHGWARQPALRTVEGVLADALNASYRRVGRLAVAGRTDRGVHAAFQVASVTVADGPPPTALVSILNSALPPDVAVRRALVVADDFHARHSARARAYLFRVRTAQARSALDARRVLHHPAPINRALLHELARRVIGTHDFTAFTPTVTQHRDFVRTVHHAAWWDAGDEIRFVITADRFLRHQVRTIVGTMLRAARNDTDTASFTRLLRGAPRREAGPTAPPFGLYLVGVRFHGETAGAELALVADTGCGRDDLSAGQPHAASTSFKAAR